MTLSRKDHLYPQRFGRNNSKLIIDKTPETNEILAKPRVIASYTNNYFGPERYKSGRVTNIGTLVEVTFDDIEKRYFTLESARDKMRLVRRPSFC